MKKILFVLITALIVFSGIVYAESVPDDGKFIYVDYDTVNPSLEKAEGSEPKHSVETDSSKNKYMRITPEWSNWGYAFSSPIPKNGGDYTVEFDFAGFDLSRSYYNIALTERATEKGENVYHQFGILSLTKEGYFKCAGRIAEGMTYEDGKWYHYKLIFNQGSNSITLEIYDKTDPSKKAVLDNVTAGAVNGSVKYGNSMPDRNYDMIKFAISGTLLVDNIVVEESREKPVIISVSSNHVGNIFSGTDIKSFDLKIRNVLSDPIRADIRYVVYNEDENIADSGSVGVIEANARETVEKTLTVNIDKYDIYDLYFDIEAENLTTGEKKTYRTDFSMFSVVNKRRESEPLNKLTAVNIEYIYNEQLWSNIKELLLQAGISGIRKDFTWYYVEASKGIYTDPVQHMHFDDTVASGIDNMAILMASNPLYSLTGDDWGKMSLWNVDTPEMWEAWEKYIKVVAKKHKDNVTYWEILNEPNEKMTAEFYCKLLKVANKAIKEVDPDAYVMGLCTASMPWAWIDTVLKTIGTDWKDYLDAISVHPYDFDGGEYRNGLQGGLNWAVLIRDQFYMDKMTRLDELMEKYGCKVPVYITEMAITSTPKVISMKGQAAELAQLYTVTDAQDKVEQLYWYCLENTSTRGSKHVIEKDTEGNFGIVGSRNDKIPFAAKPAYVALAGYNKMLTNAELTDDCIVDKTRAYRFRRPDGKQVIILWSEEGSRNISLDLGCSEIELYDIYTNNIGKIRSVNGKYDFTPGFQPIYIMGDFTKLEQCEGNISAVSPSINAVTDDVCVIGLNDKKGRTLKVEATGTPHAEVTENKGISGGEGRIVVKTDQAAFEEEPVDVKIYDGDDLCYYARYYITIKDDGIKVSYSLGDDQTGADRKVVNVSVTNNTAGVEMNGSIDADFSKIGGKLEERTMLSLKPHETKTVFLNIPKTPYSKSVASTLNIHFGGRFDVSREISVINDFTVAYNDTSKKDASYFDGTFKSNEWFAADDELAADSFAGAWGGPDDCSFKGTLGWDENNLYIYCDVKDDIHSQKYTQEHVWQGDGLQIGVQDLKKVGIVAGGDVTSYAELGVSKCEDKNEVYRWTIHPNTEMTYGSFDDHDVKIERTSGRTVYKIAFPWKEVIGSDTVSEGDEFLFNIIANDNDGAGRKGFAVLTKGIGEVKNATYFAKIKLVK